jgi:ribosomal protein S18 acetylase RimI-like enzyme
LGELTRLDESRAEEVHELLRVTWADAYRGVLPETLIAAAAAQWHSTVTLSRQMKNGQVLFAGYSEDGKLLGMARAAKEDAATLRIYQLYVLPSSQRRGIGRQLLDYCLKQFPDAKRVVLNVAKGNEKGIAFYRRYGFDFTGETRMKVGEEEIPELAGSLDLNNSAL